MVVLAAAIATRSGKLLMGRAYHEISKARLEGLLSSFHKLITPDSQHTFIDTEAVRYVYQPIDHLYVMLVTTKDSNIIEDLDTLQVLAKLLPEYCRASKEEDVNNNVFELIFAFDEVLQPHGFKEKVNVGQVKTFIEAESQDEKIFEAIEKAKRQEAKEQAKLRQAQIEKEKRAVSGAGGRGHSDIVTRAGREVEAHTPAFVVKQPTERPTAPTATATKPGLSLSKATNKTDAFLKQIGITESNNTTLSATKPSASQASALSPIHIVLDEKLVLLVSKDGGVENIEVKGDLSLTVASPEYGMIALKLAPIDQKIWKFAMHPKINKQLFASDLALTADKPFPAGNPIGVLKWRLATKDESLVPVRVSCWVSPASNSTAISLEYELLISNLELRNFVVLMPVPGSATPVIEGEGATFNAKQRILTWNIPLVDNSNSSGTLDITLPASAESASFFPVRVGFSSPFLLAPIRIQEVVSTGGTPAPMKFSSASSLTIEQYEIK